MTICKRKKHDTLKLSMPWQYMVHHLKRSWYAVWKWSISGQQQLCTVLMLHRIQATMKHRHRFLVQILSRKPYILRFLGNCLSLSRQIPVKYRIVRAQLYWEKVISSSEPATPIFSVYAGNRSSSFLPTRRHIPKTLISLFTKYVLSQIRHCVSSALFTTAFSAV